MHTNIRVINNFQSYLFIYFLTHIANQDNSISLSESLKKYQISIFGVVRKLREQRWGMVHSTVI